MENKGWDFGDKMVVVFIIIVVIGFCKNYVDGVEKQAYQKGYEEGFTAGYDHGWNDLSEGETYDVERWLY